jgi:hypothetical protein
MIWSRPLGTLKGPTNGSVVVGVVRVAAHGVGLVRVGGAKEKAEELIVSYRI